jgi:iron complex transport system substrate-binding protein
MKKLLGLILSAALLTGLLAGCGGKPAENSGSSAPAATEPASAPETSAAAEETAWPRTIMDAAGHEVVLEMKPERVTLLHVFYMEDFLLLGVPPTASAMGNALGQVAALTTSEMYAPYLKDVEIMDLGSARELNLEAILASSPDVIMTHSAQGGVGDIYDQLVQIAPVVLLNYAVPWQEQLLGCAEIVGKEAEAQKLIAEIEPVVAGARKAAAEHTDRTFALFRTDGKNFMPQGAAAYYSTFGITKPEGFPEVSGGSITLEAVAEMAPYYIVFQHNYDASVSFVKSLESSSVWQSLDAVKNGRIYYFDENMNTFGPLAMRLAAEKLTGIYSE